jgi:hypothetical protein
MALLLLLWPCVVCLKLFSYGTDVWHDHKVSMVKLERCRVCLRVAGRWSVPYSVCYAYCISFNLATYMVWVLRFGCRLNASHTFTLHTLPSWCMVGGCEAGVCHECVIVDCEC